MTLWPPLLVPPLVFLAVVSGAFALVPWACEKQQWLPLHVVALAGLAVTVGGIWLAWRDWRAAGLEEPSDKAERIVQARFLSALGLAISGISTFGMLMLWIVTYVVPPCFR